MKRLLALALILLPLIWDAYFLVAFGGLAPWDGPVGGGNLVGWAIYGVTFGLTLFCWTCATRLISRGATQPDLGNARAQGLIALGLLAWLCAQLIALQLAGAGHGWGLPFFLSMPLLGVYPVLMARGLGRPATRLGTAFLLPFALILDALLVWSVFFEEMDYLETVLRFGGGPLVAIWLSLWLGWHVLLATAWFRGTAGGEADSPAPDRYSLVD